MMKITWRILLAPTVLTTGGVEAGRTDSTPAFGQAGEDGTGMNVRCARRWFGWAPSVADAQAAARTEIAAARTSPLARIERPCVAGAIGASAGQASAVITGASAQGRRLCASRGTAGSRWDSGDVAGGFVQRSESPTRHPQHDRQAQA